MSRWDDNQFTVWSYCIDYINRYEDYVKEAADSIIKRFGKKTKFSSPVFGIVLGSGLDELADSVVNCKSSLNYGQIDNFPHTKVQGHIGRLLYGDIEGVSVICLQGRKHYYEVADMPFNIGMLQVIFAVHVLAELGVKNYLATNGSGGLNSDFNVGDIMIISSHLSLIPNPLMGQQHHFKTIKGESLLRFQPMHDAYDKDLISLLKEAAKEYPKSLREGTYLAVTGPTYETNPESIFYRDILKADAIGTSTIPEIIVARNRGMKCAGISCITNVIKPDGTNETSQDKVKAILESKETKDKFEKILRNFFSLYKAKYDSPMES